MMMHSPKKLVVAGVCALILMSCAPRARTDREITPATEGDRGSVPVITAGGPVVSQAKPSLIDETIKAAARGSAAAKAGRMMDGQERELRVALAKTKDAEISRQGNLVTVRLRGAAGFASNSEAVGGDLYTAIERIATVLHNYPRTVVRVEGHTDGQGSDAYNLDLSRRRAAAVKNLLQQLDIKPSRMAAAGRGELLPVAVNDDESGRRMNRRLEIQIAPMR